MILSMTGFGEAALEEEGHAFHIDARSVNNRYFKASLRLPDEFSFLETTLEQMLRRRLARGSVTLRLHVRDLSAGAALDINIAAVQHYVAQMQSISAGDTAAAIDLATLASLPGVCQPRELTGRQREHGQEIIARLAETAIDNLMDMRRTEGASVAEDLRTHCDSVEQHIRAIETRTPLMLTEYRDRLKSRIDELIANSNVQLAQEDLLREVSIYAERSDVSEELSRLASHLKQFVVAIDSGEPAGRKLDFIAQEMLREANTIGSKAGDAEIARRVIEIKGAIDRIKEQVQNVV